MTMQGTSKTNFLIHAHIYYAEMWEELKQHLNNVSEYSRDIWVTVLKDQKELEEQVLRDFPSAHIVQVSNVGYDIGPFVEVLKRVNLNDYHFCIKIHSKRNLQPPAHVGLTDVSGSKWRDYLLSFLKPENFRKCIEAFEKKPKLGMVGHYAIHCEKEPADERAWAQSEQWLTDCGLLTPEKQVRLSYIAGSMFMCRAHLLTPVKEILSKVEFEVPSREHPSTVSHCAERLLGHAISAAGYRIQDVYTRRKSKLYIKVKAIIGYCCHQFLRFIYQKKHTKKGFTIIKICKIPVWHGRGRDNARD